MEWVETSLGRVPVWGAYGTDRPLVLAIRGAFPKLNALEDLDPPGCDLALLHLPGFHTPVLRTTSIDAFAEAFDEVVRSRFAGRRIICLGVSVGALVALAMREVREVVAVEPFFSTAKVWPLIEFTQGVLDRGNPTLTAWVDAILGITIHDAVDRNYETVLRRRGRAVHVVAGGERLHPARAMTFHPSYMDASDHELVARAGFTLHMVPGGHAVPVSAMRAAVCCLLHHAHQKDLDTA